MLHFTVPQQASLYPLLANCRFQYCIAWPTRGCNKSSFFPKKAIWARYPYMARQRNQATHITYIHGHMSGSSQGKRIQECASCGLWSRDYRISTRMSMQCRARPQPWQGSTCNMTTWTSHMHVVHVLVTLNPWPLCLNTQKLGLWQIRGG